LFNPLQVFIRDYLIVKMDNVDTSNYIAAAGSITNLTQVDQRTSVVTHSNHDEFLKFLRSIASLCKKRKWRVLKGVLRTKRNHKYFSMADQTGISVLIVIVTHSGVPVDVVREVLVACPSTTIRQDQYGVTPLHLSCLNGTTSEIVSLISEHDKGQSFHILDYRGYSVLHYSVEYACLLVVKRYTSDKTTDSNITDTIDSEHDDCINIIKMICSEAPYLACVSNKDNGDTPMDIPHVIFIEYADAIPPIGKERLCEISEALRETQISMYRKKKKEWELQGYQPKESYDSDHSETVATRSTGSASASTFADSS